MIREKRELAEFAQRFPQDQLVLVTLTKTEGSTYQKPGARKLIHASGQSAGLITGGCLEGDIIQKALEMKAPTERHSFDTREETDRLFGSTLGCQGKMDLLFEQLNARELFSSNRLGLEKNEIFMVHIIGAGPDLDPLNELLLWSKWNHQFWTNQTDLLEQRKDLGWKIQKLDIPMLKTQISQPDRTAVLLMSHNYPTDLEVLSQIQSLGLSYIGVLGPSRRRDQMLEDLPKIYDIDADQIPADKIVGPMGMDRMGRGPSSIALSIIADLQSRFFGNLP